jgi:hypothetical protein
LTDSQNIPYGYCHCGCGAKTSIAPCNSARYGQVKGEPVRFRVGHARRRPLAERLWEKVDRRGPDECWPWTGWLQPNGYGTICRGGKGGPHAMVHRVAWELENGPIPSDEPMQVHHRCKNPACCNPAHLEALTTKGHGRAHLRPACPKGHPYDAENTYFAPPDGKRQCKRCRREYQRMLRAKRQGSP